MRLSPQQVHSIQHVVSSQLGTDTRLWLFGSRVDDQPLGGDVDLLVEPERPVALMQTLACRVKLAEALDLKVDLLVLQPGEAERPIHRIARATGLPLL